MYEAVYTAPSGEVNTVPLRAQTMNSAKCDATSQCPGLSDIELLLDGEVVSSRCWIRTMHGKLALDRWEDLG